jgi:hypothetical protein
MMTVDNIRNEFIDLLVNVKRQGDSHRKITAVELLYGRNPDDLRAVPRGFRFPREAWSHHENSVTQAGQVFSKKMNRARDATDMRQVRVGKHADVHPQSLYSGNVF